MAKISLHTGLGPARLHAQSRKNFQIPPKSLYCPFDHGADHGIIDGDTLSSSMIVFNSKRIRRNVPMGGPAANGTNSKPIARLNMWRENPQR